MAFLFFGPLIFFGGGEGLLQEIPSYAVCEIFVSANSVRVEVRKEAAQELVEQAFPIDSQAGFVDHFLEDKWL